MNILLLTPAYHPHTHPRAHRWTALAEYWAAQGHRVRVVCARKQGFPAREEYNGVHVDRCGFESLQALLYYWRPGTQRRGRVGERPGRSGLLRRLAEWVYQQVWKQLYFPDDALFWIRPAERRSRRLIEEEMPDLLITVSLPFSAHLVGRRLKRRYASLRWLVDIGDPYAIQSPPLVNSRLYGRRAERLEKEVLETADCVVVTNDALRKTFLHRYKFSAPHRLRVLPPLLWPLPKEMEHLPDQSKVRLVYAGALYPGLREPQEVLVWLEALMTVRPDWQGRLELHWYGEVTPEFYALPASKPWVHLHGLRPREAVQQVMAAADLLVHIGNRSTFQLPSKAVDYLAAGRPVLHFQYADSDPFLEFWPLPERLFTIQEGKMDTAKWKQAVSFVEKAPAMTRGEEDAHLLKTFLPDRIGDAYLEW